MDKRSTDTAAAEHQENNVVSLRDGALRPSEIFPSSLRAKGVSISTCSNWINNFIVGLITPPLVQNTGFGAYVFFAVFCFLSLAWTFYFVPETSGKTLEEMDQVFKDAGGSQEQAKRRQLLAETIRERERIDAATPSLGSV